MSIPCRNITYENPEIRCNMIYNALCKFRGWDLIVISTGFFYCLQDYIPQRAENEAEDPSSPLSSYDNIFLNENEFNKPPPELPPQIPVLLTQEASTSNTGPVPSFTHLELNHLYVHKSVDNQFVALRSTRRFRHKFVTSVLYKSL
jgi:5'-AMP-activated protein kinase regulatory beta subunit